MKIDRRDSTAALAIYQSWNDKIASDIFLGELKDAVRHCACPFTIQTEVRETIYETGGDLNTQMEAIASFLRSHQVTDYVRLAQSAEFLSDRFIQGWHTTHILRNANHVVPSYTCVSVLEKINERWLCRQQTVSFANNDVPIIIPKPMQKTDISPGKRNASDVRSTNTDPLRVYQTFINALSKANIDHDFEAWSSLCEYPHSVHTINADETIDGPQDFRATFNEVSDLIQQHGATDMLRIATEAEFISADRICGYHDGVLKRGQEIIAGPVKSRMVIRRRQDGSWGLVAVTNSVMGLCGDDFRSAQQELPSLIEIQNRFRLPN